MPYETDSFAHRVLTAVAITFGVAGMLLFLFMARQVLMLVFAAILLSVVITGISNALRMRLRLPLSPGITLIAIVCLFLGIMGLLGWFLAPNLVDQINELWLRLPEAWNHLSTRLRQFTWLEWIFERTPEAASFLPDSEDELLSRAFGIFSTAFGVVGSLAVILFISIFLAWEPGAYTENLLRLVPKTKRDRIREVLQYTTVMLRRWMVSRLIAMALVAVGTTLGLWFLGMPLGLTLGLIAGISDFIPYIGPLLGFIPAFLIALVEGPRMVFYVVLLYILVQTVESYLLVPLLERKIVRLPPAFLLGAQIFLVLFLGALGLFLATPLTVAAVILVKMLYVDDVLEDRRADDSIP